MLTHSDTLLIRKKKNRDAKSTFNQTPIGSKGYSI